MSVEVKTVNLESVVGHLPIVLSNNMVRLYVNQLAEAGRGHWIKLASEQLHSSRFDYINGIQPVKTRPNLQATITLTGALPVMVEEGWEGGFLHDTLLNEDAKISASGDRYRAIPFRHKTPGTGPTGGQPMGSQFSGVAKAMSLAAPHATVQDIVKLGKKIHRQAKKLEAGQRLRAGLAPKLRPHHTTDIFAGMKVNKQLIHVSAKGKPKFQRTYTTFRTISDAVPDKWYHPGIEGRHFASDVADHIQKIAVPALQAFVSNIVGGK